jgi:signal transduction histidine kinase
MRQGVIIDNKAGMNVLANEDYLNIFHEIKNSITLISSSLQLVEKKHPEVGSFGYWNETMSEVLFLKNMVTQLSSVRLCSRLNISEVALPAFMQQICDTISMFSPEHFSCELIMDDSLPTIFFDAQLMHQAIINLAKNAWEVMNHTGVMQIQVSSVDAGIHIAVIDQGGGLDPAFADNIFEPFITSKNGGSGLGLAITRQIAESHHGSLTCSSRPGDGCTFTIELPLTQN